MSASITNDIEEKLQASPEIREFTEAYQRSADEQREKNRLERERLEQTERQIEQRERELQREHAISEQMLLLEQKIADLVQQIQEWQENHEEDFPTIMEAFKDLQYWLLVLMKGLDTVLPVIFSTKQATQEQENLIDLIKTAIHSLGRGTKIGNIGGDFSGNVAGRDGRQTS